MKAVTLIFVLLSFVHMATAQGMTQTADGVYVLEAQSPKKQLVPSVNASYLKPEVVDGKLVKIFLPEDAVDNPEGLPFYLQPKVVGESASRSVPVRPVKVPGGYEIPLPMYYWSNGALHFVNAKVVAFEVYTDEKARQVAQ
jgi:hypothetical protein